VRAVAMEIWDEFAKKSPMAKKVIDSQKEWLRELGLLK
jgi:TRAP-type mannitol/chloroaromatic compound transport system substrate-binding protein